MTQHKKKVKTGLLPHTNQYLLSTFRTVTVTNSLSFDTEVLVLAIAFQKDFRKNIIRD